MPELIRLRSILHVFLVTTLFSSIGCLQDQQRAASFDVVVRLAAEPDRLNPILSRVPQATEIESLIFLPLSEFDPFTLEFKPVLLESLPVRNVITSGEFEGETAYDFKIRDAANWSDGKAVTAADYLFTIKTVLTPQVPAADWRGFIANIRDIQIEVNDPKRFRVIAEGEYMLTEEAISNINIYPEHVYDPNGYLSDVELTDLLDPDKTESLSANEKLSNFAADFTSSVYSRDTVVGSGPYRMLEWTTNQTIILERLEDFWGEDVGSSGMLSAGPGRIIYRIIPDETSAVNALKEGSIDVIGGISPGSFASLKTDTLYLREFDFLTPTSMQTFYIGINNKSPLLEDAETRLALAHCLDLDQIIADLFGGFGKRTIGPIHPDKPEYNHSLKPLEFDLAQAEKLLTEGGWSDTDQNGILDKEISGIRRELSLRLFITTSQLSRNLALIMQQNAANVGIDIDIIAQEFNTTVQNNLVTRDFELVAMRAFAGPTSYDPYQFWHTDNDRPDGSNFFGFGDPVSDELISQIRTTLDPEMRHDLQKEFQEILHDRQAVIFLCVGQERIVVRKDFQAKASSRSPGYFVNYFQAPDTGSN